MHFIPLLSLITFIILLPAGINSETVYKVEDESGNLTYKNIAPENQDISVIESSKTEIENYDETSILITPKLKNNEDLIKKVDNDTIYRNKALVLKEKEKNLRNEIKITKQNIRYLRDKIDNLLIDGYFADHDIFELKRQESILSSLEKELSGIDDEWLLLKKAARKDGVEPGVLRVN